MLKAFYISKYKALMVIDCIMIMHYNRAGG